MNFVIPSGILVPFACVTLLAVTLLTGVALSMYFFIIPIITSSRSSTSTLAKLQQFQHTITLGRRYLQSSSRFLGAALALLTYCHWNHPGAQEASRAKYFGTALFVLLQTAWFEIVFIFPTNDKLYEMQVALEKSGATASTETEQEVLQRIENWRKWHIGRIVMPFAAAVLIMVGLIH